MKKIITIIFLLIIAVNAQQLSKAYILSEGGFSAGSANVAMYNSVTKNYTQNIFQPGNLGLYPDGMILFGDNLFITEQGGFGGSGKVYKLDTLGSVINSAVVGTNPYSLAAANNKIYITNGPASSVSVLNAGDFSPVKTITVGVYPQEILAYNSKIYVANNSLFGGASDSTVSVINALTDEVITTITVKKNPSSLAISNDGFLLIGCPGDESTGRIYKVNTETNEIVDSFNIPVHGFGSDISVDKKSNNIYFIANSNNIVRYNLSTGENSIVINSVFPNNYYYGYRFDFANREHYVLDAKSFTVNGAFYLYDSTGTLLNTYTTGNAPKRVVFKYNEISTGLDDVETVNSFELKQNYPNPFNPSTRISYSIAENQFVTLKVYDALGREITTLVNEEKSAGSYELLFSAEGLSSGIYFYTLTAGNGRTNYSVTKKMSVLK